MYAAVLNKFHTYLSLFHSKSIILKTSFEQKIYSFLFLFTVHMKLSASVNEEFSINVDEWKCSLSGDFAVTDLSSTNSLEHQEPLSITRESLSWFSVFGQVCNDSYKLNYCPSVFRFHTQPSVGLKKLKSTVDSIKYSCNTSAESCENMKYISKITAYHCQNPHFSWESMSKLCVLFISGCH